MDKYVYFDPEITIKSYINTTFKIFYLVLKDMEDKNIRDKRVYKINEIGKEIIMLFDGTCTYHEIIALLSKKYEEDKTEVGRKVQLFLDQLYQLGYSLCEQDIPQKHTIHFIEYENYYPTVASLELTNICNLQCMHCYGSFGENKRMDVMSLENIKNVVSSLSEIGVSILELTGGDPTMNPNCADAIEIAVESGIDTVMLLTNGIYITNKLLYTLKKYKKNVYIQVDLHSLDEEYYNWFTASKGNLEKVKQNIDRLISSGVRVRICAIFTPGNMEEVYKIGEYAYEHGAVQYAPSVVTSIGRAVEKENLLFQDMSQLHRYKDLLDSFKEKYPGFVQGIIEIEGETRKNCGAIRSEVSIDTYGNIKLCNMDSGEDFKLNMGCVFQSSIKDLFDTNKIFLDSFADVDLPDLSHTPCAVCNERIFCHGCLLRGFLTAKKVHGKGGYCGWYAELPNIVKERFPLN